MYLEEALKLIRSEDAIIWAGAGFSMYAGYPNAKLLGETILNSLPDDQRQLFVPGQTLDTLCEQYCKIVGTNRKPLNKILKKVFSKKPISIEFHQKLALIPHIQTIITTNYDSLFEKGYNKKLQVIVEPKELLLISKIQPNLFKIHGDLDHENRIIITNTDYANFYNTEYKDAFWATVKERIINNNIIFIGYNFGDINIKTIINSISKELGFNRKQHFIVAPDFPEYEISDLESKNIKYISSTGEEFVNALIFNLKKNIMKDYKSGIIGKDTLTKFLASHDLTADFIATNNGHTISRISTLNNHAKQGTLSIKADESFYQQMNDFLIGKTFGQIKLDTSISRFNMEVAGINVLDENDLESIFFVTRPTLASTFDIVFENGFDLRRVPVNLYFSKYKSSVVVNFRNKVLTLDFGAVNKGDFQITIEHGKPYGNPKDELEAFQFLKYIVDGQPFTIFLGNGKKYPHSVTRDEMMVKKLDSFIAYFEMLIAVENHYEIRFSCIDEITDPKFEALSLLYQSIKTELIEYDFDTTIEATIDESTTINTLLEMQGTSLNELQFVFKDFSINLYGQTVQFKERIWTIYDAEIVNTEEVQNGSTRIKLRSKTNRSSDECVSPTTFATPIIPS